MKGIDNVTKKVESWFDTDSAPNAVDLLKQDHRKVEALFVEFTKASGANRRKQLVDQIINELTVHATVEEELVYPLLEEMPRKEDKALEAVEEHHVVKMLIADIANTKISDQKLNAKMKVLEEMVKHHVKEEEWNLLPALKRSGTDLERLGSEILARKAKLTKSVRSSGAVSQLKGRTTSARKTTARKRSTTRATRGGSTRSAKATTSKSAKVRKTARISAKRTTSNRRKASKRAA